MPNEENKTNLDAALVRELFIAIRDKDLAKTGAMLNKEPDLIKARDDEGLTPLNVAVEKDHIDMARFLLSFEPSKEDIDESRAFAKEVGYEDIIELLGQKPLSPLYLAIKNDKLAQVQGMLNENPKLVNTTNEDGLTPLNFAILSGHMDTTERIMGFNPGRDDIETSIKIARKQGFENLATFLEDRIPHPLFYAIEQNDKKAVEELLKEDPTLMEAKHMETHSPLQFAIDKEQKEMVEFFLTKEPSYDELELAYELAIEKENEEIIGIIKEAKPSPLDLFLMVLYDRPRVMIIFALLIFASVFLTLLFAF
ncbi:hypothetical protein ACFL35_11650 [Candidatus Riflebacteria bacterium]